MFYVLTFRVTNLSKPLFYNTDLQLFVGFTAATTVGAVDMFVNCKSMQSTTQNVLSFITPIWKR